MRSTRWTQAIGKSSIPWGQISDSKNESYNFEVSISSFAAETNESHQDPVSASAEHTIVVRAYDRFDNMGSGKIVVNGPADK